MELSTNAMYAVSALLIGGGVGLIYFILQRRPSRRPQGAVEWIAVTLSLFVVLGAGGLSLLALTTESDSGAPSVIGAPAPPLDFRLVDTDEERTLSDYDGKVVLLNLWATWCPPCLDELPQLNRIYEVYGPKGLVVVTISDERRETIQRFEREQLPLQTVSGYLPQERSWLAPYSRVLTSRPHSFVIDRQGIIQNVWAGAENFAFFERAVWPYLSEQAPPSTGELVPLESAPLENAPSENSQ